MQQFTLKLDPWATSSLLHKAIRRGEAELAQAAATSFYRYRGQAIWRRLLNIAFEDVGIADPDLVAEIAWLATNKRARSAIGDDSTIIQDFVAKLAACPKDRSTDYLICATLKLDEGRAHQAELSGRSTNELITIAADTHQSLIRRSAACLRACTTNDTIDSRGALRELLATLAGPYPSPLYNAVEEAAQRGLGTYILMTPILWSAYCSNGVTGRSNVQPVPEPGWVGGVPLYTFDKHTAAGKKAISRFAQECVEVRAVLAAQVPVAARSKVAWMAAFYADAVPISRQLEWPQSCELKRLGFEADMYGAGCPREGMIPVLNVVTRNHNQLNVCRREVLLRGQNHSN